MCVDSGVRDACSFELIEGDAIAWMNKTDQRFDVIIYDLPDYVKGTEFLYEIPVQPNSISTVVRTNSCYTHRCLSWPNRS